MARFLEFAMVASGSMETKTVKRKVSNDEKTGSWVAINYGESWMWMRQGPWSGVAKELGGPTRTTWRDV